MRRMPKFQELSPGDGYWYANYKGYHIIMQAPNSDCNEWDIWYIMVTDADGCYCYDGGWRDSEDKTLEQAFIEACKGAQIP